MYQYYRAVNTIAKLTPAQKEVLRWTCLEIARAEKALSESATPYLTRCHTICRGLCCRRVIIADLVHHSDFVLLLTLAGQLRERIEACLEQEDPLFPKDCIFLEKGTGPCIFPDDARPQICITAFCTEVPGARPGIRRVKRKFFKMEWYLRIWALANTLGKISRIAAPRGNNFGP
jgi:hypothetical protein